MYYLNSLRIRPKIDCNIYPKIDHIVQYPSDIICQHYQQYIPLTSLFLWTDKQSAGEKGLFLWTMMQEDEVTPTPSFLSTLASLLAASNIKIPFTVQ